MCIARGSKLQPHGISQLIQFQHITGIAVGDGDAKAYVLEPDVPKPQQSAHTVVETILESTQFIVGSRQALNADSHSHSREEALCCGKDFIRIKTIGTNYETLCFGQNDFDNVLNIFSYEWFTACNIGESKPTRQLYQVLWRNFFAVLCWRFPDIAHMAFALHLYVTASSASGGLGILNISTSFFSCADNPSWHTSNNAIYWNIFCNYGTSSYDTPTSNSNSGKNCDPGTYPNIVSNLCLFSLNALMLNRNI